MSLGFCQGGGGVLTEVVTLIDPVMFEGTRDNSRSGYKTKGDVSRPRVPFAS